jgi:hypothetical protein
MLEVQAIGESNFPLDSDLWFGRVQAACGVLSTTVERDL